MLVWRVIKYEALKMNIACWSGPRNLSTAMMYSFGARTDCHVVDEPFYAAYLKMTGIDHPMREDTIATGEVDPAKVAAHCQAPSPKPFCYQKHMTHHMLPGIDRSWFGDVKHMFLIRHPARVLASYSVKRENPTLDDIGFTWQTEIYDQVIAEGHTPVVIDSYDIRQDPETMLSALCTALDMPFDPGMLSWPSGGHAADGVWAAHWYNAVHKSTGFAGGEGPLPDVPEALKGVHDAAMPHYTRMKALALKP